MFLLTADRLCALLLLHQYRSVCTLQRVKIIIAITWFLCFCVNLPVSTAYYFSYGWNWLRNKGQPGAIITRIQLTFIPAILGILFLIFSTVAYIIMFSVYVRSRRRLQTTPESVLTAFVNSNFFTAVLLITSFLILMVTPALIHAYYDFTAKEMSVPLYTYIYASVYLSDLVDAIIYVLLYKPVKNILGTKLTRFRRNVGCINAGASS